MNKRRYLALIIRLTRYQQQLYAAADAGQYVDPGEPRRVKRALARLWELRRCEMTGCVAAEPESYAQDRKGLMSVQAKTAQVGRSVYVQADS